MSRKKVTKNQPKINLFQIFNKYLPQIYISKEGISELCTHHGSEVFVESFEICAGGEWRN